MSQHQHHAPGDCKEIFARLSEYLDGELTPAARQELETHLCGCGPCIDFVESLKRTVELCHGFEPGAAPSPLSADARRHLLDACRQKLAARPPESSR